MPIRICLLLLAMCSESVTAGAALVARQVDFGFLATVEGEDFSGRFVGAEVVPEIDSALRPLGFVVRVPLADVDSGNVDSDAEMRGPDWFDVSSYPIAIFRGDRVHSDARNHWIVHGVLELKGTRMPLAVPFEWVFADGQLQMQGQVDLDRRRFGVGPQETDSVAATVRVFFRFTWEVGDG